MPDLMTKTALMKLVAAGSVHEAFEHSIDGSFDITAMRAWAQTHRVAAVSFAIGDAVDHLRTDRVVDEQRIAELDENSWRNDPAMVVLFDNEDGSVSHLLIDGTHRILRRHKEGLTDFLCYLIPSANVIRPDNKEWVRGVDRGIDWGDDVVGDKIVKR